MQPPMRPTQGTRRLALRVGLPVGLCLTTGALLWALWQSEPTRTSPAGLQASKPSPTQTPSASSPRTKTSLPQRLPVRTALRSGETLGEVLGRLGLDSQQANQAVDSLRPYVDPRRLKPGDVYHATFDGTGALATLELQVSGKGRVQLASSGPGRWQAAFDAAERSVFTRVIKGTVESALETAVEVAGAEGQLAYQMADVLQWDLDFTRDLRRGDRFEVMFEEILLDGEYHQQGDVLAVRFYNRGRAIEAYRYADGYYDGEGRPLRKMFLRAPMRFTRVTSPFTTKRFHPVLKTVRPHWGVDYGAPVGTPVQVTANGTVISAGWDSGGGGKTVKVRHPGGYITCYLHLSRYGDGVKPGRSVQQGETIGFVGATGLATGPHLDYRVSLNGKWIDPLSLNSVPARPLASTQLAAFRTFRDEVRTGLVNGTPGESLGRRVLLAGSPEPTGEAATTRAGRR